ncbi:Hypothetical protein A7982_05184 [Minicystis rosea]|nr:Hypothetical protein A7982_05184 [Minicystis rosea]
MVTKVTRMINVDSRTSAPRVATHSARDRLFLVTFAPARG